MLEQHLLLADAVTRGVAYNSPSPVEEYRASVNREVLELRAAVDQSVDDPAEEDDAFEDHAENPAPVDAQGEPVAADPGIVEQTPPAPQQ